MASNVRFCVSFLNDLNLSELTNRFVHQGYDEFKDIACLTEKDLENLIVMDKDQQSVILNAANNLPIQSWLEAFSLTKYTEKFIEEGITNIKNLKALEITEDAIDRLEIMVPGHRKRFRLSVQSLQPLAKEREDSGPFHPEAIAVGYWIRPQKQFFEKLEHDLLCVKGFFKSDKDDSKQSDLLEFVVDSASDVVTARQAIIDELKLEFQRTVNSHGINTSALKPLYKGFLKVGKSHWIEVEVQPDEYESVGSTVMRRFLHYINGTFHQWLPLEAAAVHT